MLLNYVVVVENVLINVTVSRQRRGCSLHRVMEMLIASRKVILRLVVKSAEVDRMLVETYPG